MFNKLQNAFNRVKSNPVDEQVEDIQYAQDVERTQRKLLSQLHSSDHPKEFAMGIMKIACEFYQADWAGILLVDLDLDIWTPIWWYNTCQDDKTGQILDEFESSDYLLRWITALKTHTPIIVPNIEEIKDEYPKEYNLYKRVGMESVMGVPFKPRPTGFFALRNVKRYVNRSSMLEMLAVVALTAVNEKKFLESSKLALSPDDIHSDKDIIINVFGSLEIYTSKGVLHEDDIKSPKMCRLLIYLLLNKRTSHPPKEIVDAIWPDGESDQEQNGNNLRGLVYRFRQAFALISDYQLIESSNGGYRFNPELRIMTDMDNFDKAWRAVQNTTLTMPRMEYIKKALWLYKGEMYPPARGELWMATTSTHYSLRYLGLVNELLACLAEAGDFVTVNHVATKTLAVMPENVKAHFWLIYSTYRSGAIEMAKSELDRAKIHLTREEFDELIRQLKETREKEFTEQLNIK